MERSLHNVCSERRNDAGTKHTQSGVFAMFGRMNLADCQALFILGGSAFVASALSTNHIAPHNGANEIAQSDVGRGNDVRGDGTSVVDAPRMNGESTATLAG
ncbi:MAG: hypothetical protein C0483_12575 [Pirellula sp.]|nr:hypothetical protein [Pirellula sp.]